MVRSLMGGSAEVGRIVCTPVPGMLNATTLSCAALGAAAASLMAWRSDPAPLSLVLVTVNVVARAPTAARDNTVQIIAAEIFDTGAPECGWLSSHTSFARISDMSGSRRRY